MSPRVYLLILLMLIPTLAQGAPQSLTVREAIDLALHNNDELRAAGYRRDAVRQGTAIAAAAYYPLIIFEETFAASTAPTQAFMMKLDQGRFRQEDFQIASLNSPATTYDFKTLLTLQQPLFEPTTAPLVDRATREAEREESTLQRAREEIAFRVFQTYLDVQKYMARHRAAEQAIEEARETMRLAGVRLESGVGLRSDELRARTHLSVAEQAEIAEHNNLMLARLRLAHLLGLEEDTRFEVQPAIAPVTPGGLLPEQLIRLALDNRQDLKGLQSEVERSEAELRLARGSYLPSVGAFASYQRDARDAPLGADNDAWSAGITLKWPLFDGFRRYRQTDRATAARSAAAILLAHQRRQVELGVRESYLRRMETGKRLEVARHALLDAEETVRLIARRFENSLATMAELLDAQTVLNQLRAALVEAEADYALAGGRVYYAAGVFVKEMSP